MVNASNEILVNLFLRRKIDFLDIVTTINEIFKDKVIDVCNTLKTISLELGYTMAQIAQAWVLSKPEVSVIISGADNTEQLDENLISLEVKLPKQYIEMLNEVSHNLHIPLDNIRYSTKTSQRSY